MKKIFSKSRIQLEQMLQDISSFTKEVYKQSSLLYSPASPWGQIMTVLGRLGQLIIFYIEDSITELNVHTASRPQSIKGLARLAGHNPTRAIAATGDISLVYTGNIPNINGENVIIRNFTKVTCKDNQLPYLIVLGRDSIRYNLYNQKNILHLRVIQGVMESQSFTGTGEKLQSFEVNISGGSRVDNFFINIFVNGEKWKKYDSLYDIPKDAKGYLVKTGITSGVDVYFGNGYFGAIPELGSEIIVEYLVTAGEGGNIRETSGVMFEFSEEGYDDNGHEVDLNSVFNISISNPITFGSDPESTFLTRLLAPTTSRSFVLANTSNYISFFEKFQYFSFINAYTEYNVTNWFIDNIIYLVLVPDIAKRLRSGENYFTVPLEYFSLTNLEKFKIQKLLEESGQKIVNAVVRFVDPQFKRYCLNVYLSVWSGSNKDTIREEIISQVSEYLIKFKRKDFLPKSDLISILENIDGIDSVNLYFISENIEAELYRLLNYDYIDGSLVLTKEERNELKALYDSGNYTSIPKKLSLIFEFNTFKKFVAKHIDENGDIVLNKNERPLVRGGWKDRNGTFYSDLLNRDKLSAININIVKENPKDINTKYHKYNLNEMINNLI